MHLLVPHLRAALILAVGAVMLLLATPGLDLLDPHSFDSPQTRERQLAEPFGAWTVAMADLNRAVRLPLVRAIEAAQRPLRIAQSWSLYAGGAADVRRLELVVDGVVRYRSNDPDATWLAPTLRYRRVRPMVVALCHRRGGNAEELLAYIVRRARREFPGAAEVVARCVEAPWPEAGQPTQVLVQYRAAAPSFELVQ